MRLLLLICVILLSGCAQIKSLDGGAKDTQAPVLVSSSLENESLNFKDKSVNFSFDEYIALNDIQGQLIFSPQLRSFPDVQVKGKNLTISWKDTLLENTTYQFDFGNAIVDNTEGNPVAVSRVFSTGNLIDSLQIVGRVNDAWTQLESAGSVVQLVKDLPVLGQSYQPMYQVKTKTDGIFEFKYLSSTPYYVIAFNDANGNARWDDKEPLDWTTQVVFPKSIPDSIFMTQANTLIPNNGFWDIHVDSCGWMSTFWDHRWNKASIKSKDSVEFDVVYEGDSLFVYLNQLEREGYFTFTVSDSAYLDSLNIPCFKEAFLKRKIQIPPGKRILRDEVLTVSLPWTVTGWDNKKWKWTLKDSAAVVNGNWHKDQHELRITPPYKGYVGEANLEVFKGGLYADDWLLLEDTLNINVEWLSEEQTGFFQLTSIPVEWRQYTFQLESGKHHQAFNLEELEKGVSLIPGKYHLQVWDDRNGNGFWDNHDYPKGIKSENVIYRSKEMNIRANWQEVLGL